MTANKTMRKIDHPPVAADPAPERAEPQVRDRKEAHWASWGEGHLSMPRKKPRYFSMALAYRATRLGRRLLGEQRVLRIQLFLAWLFHRLALESSIALYGDDFRRSAFGLTDDTLLEWIPAGGSVLDLGCGVGRWSRLAARHAHEVVGVDYDVKSIALARHDSTEPNVTYVIGDLTRPLSEIVQGRRFDVTLLLHILEHIEDVQGFLRPLREVANRLIIEVPDFESNPLNEIRWRVRSPFYSDADHVREYTMGILQDQLALAGWKIERSRRRGGVILASAVLSQTAYWSVHK